MTKKQLIETLKQFFDQSICDNSTESWTKHDDSLSLLANLGAGVIPGFAYSRCHRIFMYAVLVPKEHLTKKTREKLLDWNFGMQSGFSYTYEDEEGKIGFKVTHPIDSYGPPFKGSIQVFNQRFQSIPVAKVEDIEPSQLIADITEAARIKDRFQWCKYDENDDIAEVFGLDETEDIALYSVNRYELGLAELVTNTQCIIFFEFVKTTDKSGWYAWDGDTKVEEVDLPDQSIFARRQIAYRKGKPHVSSLRGFLIVPEEAPPSHYIAKVTDTFPQTYESFVIQDLKNGLVIECSCDPKSMSNYFTKSDLPFETSPVFFKPELVGAFRSYPEKYRIDSGQIVAPSWSIRYDVNDEGLIFVILHDLSRLPHKVQLMFKAYNVPPLGGISERAEKQWYRGDFDLSYDPLDHLKYAISVFEKELKRCMVAPIWTRRDTSIARDIQYLNYVLTNSIKEWEDQIEVLQQLTIEGLNSKYIAKLSVVAGCRNKDFGSLRQLREYLVTKGIDACKIDSWHLPLARLQKLRSESKSHVGRIEGVDDYRKHFRETLESVEKSMQILFELAHDKNLFPF